MTTRPRRELPSLVLFLVAVMTAGAQAAHDATTPRATTEPVAAADEETESGGDYVVFTRGQPRARSSRPRSTERWTTARAGQVLFRSSAL